MRNCPRCSREIFDAGFECIYCGADVRIDAPTPGPPKPPSTSAWPDAQPLPARSVEPAAPPLPAGPASEQQARPFPPRPAGGTETPAEPASPPAHFGREMLGAVVYQDASITVTLSRVTAEGRSYDLATVRRASVELARSTRWGCTAAFWSGLVAFGFLGTGDVGPALFSIAVGIVAWRASSRPNYALRLLIHDGVTHDVLHDRRRDRIEKIATQINRALGVDRDDRRPATGPASPERAPTNEKRGG